MTDLQPGPAEPKKQAKQDRSKLLMRSVRDAAIELIRRDGADKLTASGIADRAGIGIGSFYQYYPNSEAVLTDIFEHILDRLNREMIERISVLSEGVELSFEENMKTGVEVTVSLHRELLAVHASFYVKFINRFNAIDARGPDHRSWNDWSAEWLSNLLMRNRDRVRHEDVEYAATFILNAVSGALQRMVALNSESLNDDRIKQDVFDLICRYVLIDF